MDRVSMSSRRSGLTAIELSASNCSDAAMSLLKGNFAYVYMCVRVCVYANLI